MEICTESQINLELDLCVAVIFSYVFDISISINSMLMFGHGNHKVPFFEMRGIRASSQCRYILANRRWFFFFCCCLLQVQVQCELSKDWMEIRWKIFYATRICYFSHSRIQCTEFYITKNEKGFSYSSIDISTMQRQIHRGVV